MIILDTNVLSEPTRPAPSATVRQWLLGQDRDSLFTTTISEAEMIGGVAIMPAGKRRDGLAFQINQIFVEEFAGRVLPFDGAAAREFPLVARPVHGRYVIEPDTMIAAIALAHGATLATRNTKHFAGRGLALINPWTA